MNVIKPLDRELLAESIEEGSHTSIGRYPKYAIMADGGTVCMHCLEEETDLVMPADGSTPEDQWCVLGIQANWEDPGMFCDNCGDRIESAYAEDDS